MSEPQQAGGSQADFSRDEMMSALFAQLVMQQANMAMMLLGKTTHPETGQVIKDLEAAKLFIDQLEMLEAKTKGNLSKEESGLLKQSLMSLRLSFVEAVGSTGPKPTAPSSEAPVSGVETAKTAPAPGAAPAEDDEHRKKFSKKY